MTDERLRPATPEEIAESIAFALRYEGRKRVTHADDMMARITADRLVRHLQGSGFVLMKQPDGQVKVFSPMCTHLGCGYRWDGEEKQFKCPCHGSVFDIEGKVVAGPAPRPLDLLPSKIENGRLLVVFKEFKPGTSQVVEL